MTINATSDDLLQSMFSSVAALRSAHAQLITQRRADGDTIEILQQITQFVSIGSATGALIDSDSERWAIQSLLDYWVNILDRSAFPCPDPALIPFDPTLAPELDDTLCPYLGLDTFREENSHLFFGRQRLVSEITTHLQMHGVVALVGSSGSGKSSLVRAGLVPALRAGALQSSRRWHYFPAIVPGSNPLGALAQMLIDASAEQAGDKGFDVDQLAAAFRDDHSRLATLMNMISLEAGPYETRRLEAGALERAVVLVIDQFEELFTLCDDADAREAFVGNLLALVQTSRPFHRVVLTMRSDFETYIMRMPRLQEQFEVGRFQITPLSASELREAIERPAEMIGLKFEAELVDTLLQDILGEPAALPLLQFTLLKLWEHRERNLVTWDSYRKVGSGRLALARSADQFYDQLIPEEQITTKRLLLRMVRPTTGLEVTSNRIRRETLYKTGEAHDRVNRVLTKLIGAKLVRLTHGKTQSDDQVEVAHEALVRNWPRLVDWLDDERAVLRQRVRLTAAAEHWRALGKDPSALLRGTLLTEALSLSDLNRLESQFLRASLVAADMAEQQTEAARRRELEQARSLASAEARAEAERGRAEEQVQQIKRIRQLTIVIAVVGLLALSAAILAIFERQQLLCDARVGNVFVLAWQRTRRIIGCPTGLAQTLSYPNKNDYYGAAEEPFEHGYMFWRHDIERIYVLQNDGTWRNFPDTRTAQDPTNDPTLKAPKDRFQPVLGFYKVWHEQLGGPSSSIGWALEPERPLTLQAQDFGQTLMFFSDRLGVFILYSNGHWEKA